MLHTNAEQAPRIERYDMFTGFLCLTVTFTCCTASHVLPVIIAITVCLLRVCNLSIHQLPCGMIVVMSKCETVDLFDCYWVVAFFAFMRGPTSTGNA